MELFRLRMAMNGAWAYFFLESDDASPISAEEGQAWAVRELQKNGCGGLPWMEVQKVVRPREMVNQFIPWPGGRLLAGTRTFIFPPELTRFMNG